MPVSKTLAKNLLGVCYVYRNTVIEQLGDPELFGWLMLFVGPYLEGLIDSSECFDEFEALTDEDRSIIQKNQFYVLELNAEEVCSVHTFGDIFAATIFWQEEINTVSNKMKLQELGISA